MFWIIIEGDIESIRTLLYFISCICLLLACVVFFFCLFFIYLACQSFQLEITAFGTSSKEE